MVHVLAAILFIFATASAAPGQTPQPFPGASRPPQPPAPRATTQAPASAADQTLSTGAAAPSSEVVGFPVYPNATFLGSYEAGRGQRYYLFGTPTSYGEMVKYYQTVLRDRGARVYDEPATHTFAQRFREETMAFPPGVTIKDWTSNGSFGYPHAAGGGPPERFPTVIMIVPPPVDVPVEQR